MDADCSALTFFFCYVSIFHRMPCRCFSFFVLRIFFIKRTIFLFFCLYCIFCCCCTTCSQKYTFADIILFNSVISSVPEPNFPTSTITKRAKVKIKEDTSLLINFLASFSFYVLVFLVFCFHMLFPCLFTQFSKCL